VSISRFPRPALFASLRTAALLAAAALSATLCATAALAADSPMVNEKFADMEPAIQMLRQEVGQDRREIVKSAMLLTQSEAATFWPLYDGYRTDMHKLGDRRVKLITDFAANRNAMSEDQAEHLTHEALSIEEDTVSTKRDWVGKMSKVLSARTVARFFQIDSKLDAVVNAELASRIPLIH
jgi:Spy/CpxP family protein refolding chaperone